MKLTANILWVLSGVFMVLFLAFIYHLTVEFNNVDFFDSILSIRNGIIFFVLSFICFWIGKRQRQKETVYTSTSAQGIFILGIILMAVMGFLGLIFSIIFFGLGIMMQDFQL